jgi:hypothetical protein
MSSTLSKFNNLRAIINGYENELDNILINTNDIIKKYKSQLESL